MMRPNGDSQCVLQRHIIHPEVDPYPSATGALLWVTPLAPPVDVAADLAILFGLTAAEKCLVRRLIAGDELKGAAAGLGITANTARTQLKSIFSKTGRRTQASLLTLAARLEILRIPIR